MLKKGYISIFIFILTVMTAGYTVWLYLNPINNVSHIFEYFVYGCLFVAVFHSVIFHEKEYENTRIRVLCIVGNLLAYGVYIFGLNSIWYNIVIKEVYYCVKWYDAVSERYSEWTSMDYTLSFLAAPVICLVVASAFFIITAIVDMWRDYDEADLDTDDDEGEESDEDETRDLLDEYLENVSARAVLGKMFRTGPLLKPVQTESHGFREVLDSDVDMLQKIFENSEVPSFCPIKEPFLPEDKEQYARILKDALLEDYKQGTGFYYIITDKNNTPEGIFWLSDINIAERAAVINIYLLDSVAKEDNNCMDIMNVVGGRLSLGGFIEFTVNVQRVE